jgi:protein-disulfide isomerase
MHKFWLTVAALCLMAPVLGSVALAVEAPQITPKDRVLGQADAPITIIEYASLTCPHCAAFDHDTLPKIKQNWIDTGKAKLVYRDFPLDGLALRAAMVARCAPPERYFSFIDALFQGQSNWARSSNQEEALGALGRFARLGGISDEKFQSCIKDEKLADAVAASRVVAAQEYGVDSTPTFFINGTKMVGEASYEAFDKALAAAQPKT